MADASKINYDGTIINLKDSSAVKQVKVGSSAYNPSSGVVSLPAYPTVNNATLTIQKNGTNVQTFTANSSSNKTANITVPTKTSELTNDSGYTTNTGTVTQVKVGSTAYDPSSGVVSLPAYPTVPTVNNATLTIQKNGTNVQTFTANASANKTANITVPTKTSELTNDSGYITNAGVTGVKGNSETTYRTGNVNITKANIGLGSVGNFKAVSTIASQGLTNTEKSNARANIGAGTSSFSGSYTDLTNKPTIPTVNNATLTIQKNGTTVKTFTANASSNVTANITVPTKTSQLTNDSNFLVNGGKGATTSASLTVNSAYTTTNDGYLTMSSGASAGSAVVVSIQGSDGVGLASVFEVTATQNLGSSQAVYIKKGMKLLCTRKDSGCSAVFYPITY